MTFVPLSPVPPSTGSSSSGSSSSVPRSPGAPLHAALNPPQREAVEHIDGPLLVIAGAGSGKTRVITHRIAHMISQGGVAPHQILAVTFTNKAASEMRERVLQLLGLPPETHLPLGTFHSRCAAILRREAIHAGLSEHYQILDDNDQVNVLKEILRRMGIEPKQVQPSQALEVISWAKTNLLEPEDTVEVDEFKDPKIPHPEIYKNYQEFLTQNDAVDFDDLLMKTVRLFERNEHILDYWRRRYPYVLVDEYQDTNPAQFRLLQLLAAEHRNLCVVGDEDQSIYSWRGADIHNLLDFQKQFPEARLIRLEQNYRSTQRILQCADSVIVNNKKRLGKTLFTQGDAGEPVVYTRLMDSREEAQWIASKIRELHLHKQCPYSNVAIFYRLNALSRSFEDALREAHIPYRIIGSVRFYDRAEIRDLLSYLRLAENPNNDLAFLRVANVPKRGAGDSTIQLIRDRAQAGSCSLAAATRECIEEGLIRARAAAALTEFLGHIAGWHKEQKDIRPGKLLEKILDDTKYRELHLGDEHSLDAITRRENIEEFINTLTQWGRENKEGRIGDWLEEVALTSSSDVADGDQKGVSLMTLHCAKGLEFDAVFITALEYPLFPLQRSVEEAGDSEEERRLFYVGVTRARKMLFLTHAAERMLHGNFVQNEPSQFLFEITPEVFEQGQDPKSRKKKSSAQPYSPWNRNNFSFYKKGRGR